LIETMIDATVRSIVCRNTTDGVAVLCTPLSFSCRHLLLDRIKKHGWDYPVHFVPCPYLARFIEDRNWGAATQSVMDALATVPYAFDRVVYGCTHYALLHNRLPESMQAIMIDPADYYDVDGANGHPCDTSKGASSSSGEAKVTTLFYTGSVPTESVRHYVHSACRFIPVPSSIWNTNESARAGCGPDQRSVGCA
jgi:glutamate racemase